MVCTGPPTAGRPGPTWACPTPRHIGRVRVHPANPDLVYVAALGHAYGPNDERGVFRSKDGGNTWEKVLFRSQDAGAIDLSMDPNNPRILYASIWETRRTPWSLISGGPGSGIFKSVDGGDTWTEITDNPGLPGGLKGRIGIAVSPAKSGRVWATIEAEDCGVYRSDDGGDTWELVSDERDLQGRPWYYQHIFADPQDADTVWILNYQCWKSVDGGRNFSRVTTPHGDDHDLWIDPNNPLRMIEGNDGGACVSFNGGETWSSIYNQLTAQFYHLTTDNRFPHRVYGTQQDNTAISVPSRTHKGAIPWGDCYVVGNSEEWLHRPASGGSRHGDLGSDWQFRRRWRQPAALRPRHRTGADHHGVARALHRLGRQGHAVPLPVDLSHHVLAP